MGITLVGITLASMELNASVNKVAMLSMHTSPLAQPGRGDSGGMNVFVRELGAALAQAGVSVRTYVRRADASTPDVVTVEPGFEVCQITAGAFDLDKHQLPGVIDEFADGVRKDIEQLGEAQVLHANYWLSAQAAHRIKHELSLPLVTTFHTLARVKSAGGDVDDDDESSARAEAEAAIIGCSDIVTAATAVEAAELRDLYRADPARIEWISPGVDRAFFSPGDQNAARRASGLTASPTVLFVGRIQPLKGLDLAVDAISLLRHQDAQLVIVGGPSGDEGAATERAIRQRISELGLEHRVTWCPPKPHHLLSSYYRAADVVVVPSRSESFGLVALEAAACGTPVVASDVGGLSQLVVDGETGLLVPRTAERFASALDLVLGHPSLADRMGTAAATRAQRFTWSATAARLRRCYSDLAARALVSCD